MAMKVQRKSSYATVKEFLRGLDFGGLNHWRGDCPVCLHENTLSVTIDYGDIWWKCFSASCDAKGFIDRKEMHDELGGTNIGWTSFSCLGGNRAKEPFSIPDYFCGINGNGECLQYLVNNHCIDAYMDGRADIRYDPKQNRIVFLFMQEGKCHGAAGRSLDGSVRPKWYNYPNGDGNSFTCNTVRHSDALRRLVMVEDCASACSASSVVDAISLLGTSLSDPIRNYVRQYDTVFIALDKDATQKSLDIQRILRYNVNRVEVVPLQRDLKYLEPDEIRKVLNG